MRIIIGILIAIAVLAVMLTGVQAQSDEGLVAEWHFDEGSGSVLKDSSGNGNDGTIYGATWVEGKYGKALSFDGTDDYVNQASLFNDVMNSFTTELWVYPSVTHQIDSISSSITSGTSGQRYVTWPSQGDNIYGTNHACTGLSIGTNGISIYEHAAHYMPALLVWSGTISGWTHVIVGYENNNIKLYINGNLVGSGTSQKNCVHPSGQIGGGQYGYFKGLIDEVRIYNRILTAEEIKEHFEQGPTAISLTKTASPQSIKQGQSTTITLTVKNTGSKEIKDIEIADTIPSYLTFLEGETSKRYDSLAPKDTRQISYTLQFNDAGTFNLEPVIATYADDKGNYNTVKSKPASIEVIRSIIENSAQTPKPMNGNVQSASVNLYGEKTDVALGEDVLLKLSAVNIIGNPTMHVQVIIIPPSGWSVTSSEFAKSGAGQYTTTYELESGGGKDIEVRIVPNQISDDFQVEGRIIYYFGDDLATREDHTLSLPIKVRAEPDDGEKSSADSEDSKTPGFGVLVAVIGLLMTAHLIKRK